MVTRGLLVRLTAKAGKDEAVEEFLHLALGAVRKEPSTTAWFGIRFGRSEYGIFDVFSDDTARDAHLAGPLAKLLLEDEQGLFSAAPRIQKFAVIADKLPAVLPPELTKALLLTFKAKARRVAAVEDFLRGALQLVQAEPKTAAWFAIRLESGEYGIFDLFPDNMGRFEHLTGHVPRELAKHALSLLGSIPDLRLLNVVAAKL